MLLQNTIYSTETDSAALAMLFLFLISILQGVVTHEMVAIPALVAGNCGCEGSCPSVELQKAIQMIKNEARRSVLSIHIVPQCGDGLWRRVGYLNMSDITQQCPQLWREYNSSEIRACGRPISYIGSCSSSFYPTHNQYTEYRHVCGRIIGYQVGSPSAFVPSRELNLSSFLDDVDVDGVSVTHGSPRSHIWTYAAGSTEGLSQSVIENCPCHYEPNNTKVVHAPNSIQNSTYCESGNGRSVYKLGFFYSTDPLWDGEQCESEGYCCSNDKSPPWFSVQLPNPTSDDIEVRICGNQDTNDEDNPIALLELYIQ